MVTIQALLLLTLSSLFFQSYPTFSFFFSNINSKHQQRATNLSYSLNMQRISNALESLFHQLPFGGPKKSFDAPVVMGDESIMSKKKHGTSNVPVQENLRWDVDQKTADRICNFNRHYAEHFGYWKTTSFPAAVSKSEAPVTFYDSNTGKPLFTAPKGRTMESFLIESQSHGWPSFRDDEVVWENVRILPNGEAVSVDGTHLGHNLPDRNGNRYCINLVSVAGNPEK